MPRARPGKALLSEDDKELTRRESQVLKLMGEGLADKEIAAKLFITYNTLKNYTKAISRKLEAKNRTHAVVIGFRKGLLTLNFIRSEFNARKWKTILSCTEKGDAVVVFGTKVPRLVIPTDTWQEMGSPESIEITISQEVSNV